MAIKPEKAPKAGGSARLDGLMGYQLRRASGLFMADFVELFREIPLRPAQYAILSLVEENPGISQSELSRVLAIKKTNMVPLVVELERRGLLKRAADTADRRVQLLTLAPGAAKQVTAWQKKVAAHEEAMMRHLSQDERGKLFELLGKLRSGPAV